jgi:hypothetical protein
VFGGGSSPPPPGPNFSPVERARAVGALRRYRAGKSVRKWLLRGAGSEEEEEEEGPRRASTGVLNAFGRIAP